MNSHYFNDLDEYELDNEESVRPRWKETRESKIGMDSQNLQPFRKELLHVQDSIMLPKTTNDNYKMTEERIEAFYREKEIIIKTFENQKVPPPFLSWASADFPTPILESIEQLKFKNPTIIQSVVFPIILAGYDVIGIAQTGSGKTIAYLLPGLIQITTQITEELNNAKKQNGPQMLILVPTRELAMQIESEIQLFTQNYRLKTLCIYGGINNRKNQFYNLGRCPNILVATPGRLLDFLREEATTLANVSYLVIDEADRLLELGFEDTIREIVQQIRIDRQTVFFSATWPKAVKDLAFDFCQYSPIYVQIGKSNLTINKNIDQEIICLFQKDKLQQLLDILDTLKISDKVLIFSEQKQRCEQLSINMADKGYYTIALHGDKTQPQRDEIMKAFRSGYTRLLCATDLASRGLDVTDITVVINYDFPKYFDDYIHRIGRTGRGEKKGKAFSFLAYDKDEPRMAKELLKLAQVANLKYDDSALQNFAIGIFPQMQNDFEFDRFKQQQSRSNNQRGNFQFSKNSQEQYHNDNQKSRYPQDNRGSQGENNNYSKYSNIQKEDGSNGDSNYNFRFKDKFQDQSQQYGRDSYQGRNQWKDYGNHKDYRNEKSQNYYQNGDKKQFYGKQDRFDNRQQRQEQSFDQSNKYNNDQKDRHYENGRQERQFRQQGQDWSQNGQDKQEYGEDKQLNRYDRPKWQQFQENQDGNYRQDKFDRFNKKQQYNNRQYQDQEDDKGLQNDRQGKSYRQYDREEPSNRENRRVNFIDQSDDRYENNQQQYQSRFPHENNSSRWDNQRNQKQQDYWNNNKRQQPYQQRFNGGQDNPRSFDNQGEDFKNSRQEECKRQYTSQADEGNAQEWKHKQQENNDTMKNQKEQHRKNQVRFDVEDDKQHQSYNNFSFQGDDNKRNYKQNRSFIQDRHEDSRSQTFRNNDSINHHNQNQGRNYWDQNDKRRNENFRDTRQSNNQQFDFYNNSRKQNDNQNRIYRNQIEQNGNEDNKFKSFRNTQSLERNQQIRFYNSKQITRNGVKTDDQQNIDQQQRQISNNIWKNRNNDPQNNQEDVIENQEIAKQIKNLDEDKGMKISSQIIQKPQEMEEINELQEYNFNYNPNKSSDDGEIEDDYDKIEQENKQIDNQISAIQNHNIDSQSEPQTNDQIKTIIAQEQQDEKKDQIQIVEDDDTKQIKSNINEREQDNAEDISDNEYDFTRFSRILEQENRLKFESNPHQYTNKNRLMTKEEEEEEVKVDPKQV